MGIKVTETGVQYVQRILDMVAEVRAENHSCTMREFARQLGKTPMMMHRQLNQLREMGFVDWTDLDGSVHLTVQGQNMRKRIAKGTVTEMSQLPGRSVADDPTDLQPAS